jgi:hypothetical protein
MTKSEFSNLRNSLFESLGLLSTAVELEPSPYYHSIMSQSYASGCDMLDSLNVLGVSLGYIDEITNEEIEDVVNGGAENDFE